MANTYKVLGQSAPSITTPTNVYTVPADTEAVISTIVVCNRGVGESTYRLSIRPGGVVQSNAHWVAYDVPLQGNDSVTLTLGLTLQATDVVTFYTTTGDVSVSLFGTEITG